MPDARVCIRFQRGTLLLEGISPSLGGRLPGTLWDPRVRAFRAPAWRYADILSALRERAIVVDDTLRPDARPQVGPWADIELRPYQQSALTAWDLAGARGIIALPTGSGKTRVAVAALASRGVRALCLVPTRVLLHQWRTELARVYFGRIGCVGDGERHLGPVTVCTFESAYRYASRFGGIFDLVVIDEVHHFGDRVRDEALEMCVAPMRLGLTATLPNDPVQMSRLVELVGPLVYRLGIGDLAGTYLADFDIIVLRAPLDTEESLRYAEESRAFEEFRRSFRQLEPEATWKEFVSAAQRTAEGRRALASWRKSRRIVAFPSAKRRIVRELLARHRDARLLVFTADNDTAYAIARAHLIMPLTCDIKRRERDRVLDKFRKGELRALVSSRVLNEGLDVPDAEVAIIVGGALGEREHVQRVGRLLRPAPGKRAIVYEVIVPATSEAWSSKKRRRALGSYTVHSV